MDGFQWISHHFLCKFPCFWRSSDDRSSWTSQRRSGSVRCFFFFFFFFFLGGCLNRKCLNINNFKSSKNLFVFEFVCVFLLGILCFALFFFIRLVLCFYSYRGSDAWPSATKATTFSRLSAPKAVAKRKAR